MTTIPGASGFLTAARFANVTGQQSAQANLLGDSGIGGLLEVGRRFRQPGIGLSASARASTKQFLDNTSGLGNALLSAPAEANSVDNLRTKILALRSSLSPSQLARGIAESDDVIGNTAEEQGIDNPFVNVTRGSNVDTSA